MKVFGPVFCVLLFLLPISSLSLNVFGQSRRSTSPESMTDEELSKVAETEKIRAINRALRNPEPYEKHVVGNIQKIDCGNGIKFTVTAGGDTFTLESKHFDSIALNAFVPMSKNSLVGCETDVSAIAAVITYKMRTTSNGSTPGEIRAIEFVPPGFRLMSQEEMNRSFAIDPSDKITDPKEQAAIIRGIRQTLYRPKEGETQQLGYLDKIECGSNARYYVIKVVAKTYRLLGGTPETVPIRLFTRELEGMQFGCAMQPIDVPLVFIFREKPDPGSGSDGEIVSLEFVPRGFSLN